MKKLNLFYFLILFICFIGCKQKANGQAPEAVQSAFEKKYPGENDPDWHKDAHGYYESHFKIDGIKYRADFNANGTWVETETNIDPKDLPKVIKDKIETLFDDMEITEVEKVEHHSKGTFYDVEFKQKGKNKDVEFKPNGEIIN